MTASKIEAIAVHPNDTAISHSAKAEHHATQPPSAGIKAHLDQLSQGIQYLKDSTHVHDGIHLIVDAVGKLPPEESILEDTCQLMKELNQWDAWERIANKALRHFPANMSILPTMLLLSLKRGHLYKGYRYFCKALQATNSPTPDLLRWKPLFYRAAQRYDEAGHCYETELAQYTNHPDMMEGQAQHHYLIGQPEQGLALYQQLTRLAPSMIYLHNGGINALLHGQGNAAEAFSQAMLEYAKNEQSRSAAVRLQLYSRYLMISPRLPMPHAFEAPTGEWDVVIITDKNAKNTSSNTPNSTCQPADIAEQLSHDGQRVVYIQPFAFDAHHKPGFHIYDDPFLMNSQLPISEHMTAYYQGCFDNAFKPIEATKPRQRVAIINSATTYSVSLATALIRQGFILVNATSPSHKTDNALAPAHLKKQLQSLCQYHADELSARAITDLLKQHTSVHR